MSRKKVIHTDGKACTKCQIWKPLSEYGSGGEGRLSSHCKECKRQARKEHIAEQGYPTNKKEQDRRYRAASQEKLRAYRHDPDKKARAKHLQKERYHRNPRYRELNRRWREANREKVAQITKLSKAKKPDLYRRIARVGQHHRRAKKREAEGRFTGEEWLSLCEKYGNKCLRCGSAQKLVADHVIALSKGGSNGIENIQPLCRSCNAKKWVYHADYRPSA